ncbi:MAG TPA: hypothetical protein VM221_07505 [Armatimonadota bacterium]|nr:hypothetical protein [Armatimonadota bacterium]
MLSRTSIGLVVAVAWWIVCAPVPDAVRADTFDAGEAALGDQRLAKPLTLDLTQEPVSDLLARIGAATGVRLSARQMDNDKVNVFVNDLPARDLLAQVAKLYRGRWERGDGEYVLASPDDRELLCAKAMERYRAAQEARYRKLVSDALANLGADDGQLRQIAREDPELALNLAVNSYPYTVLAYLTPEQFEDFFDGGKPILMFNQMPAELQSQVRDHVSRLETDEPSANVRSDRLGQTGYKIYRNGKWGMTGVSTTIWQPNSDIFSGGFGNVPEWSQQDWLGRRLPEAADRLGIVRDDTLKFQWQRRIPRDTPNEAFTHAPPPTIEMKPRRDNLRGAGLTQVERALHEEYGVQVVADSYCRFQFRYLRDGPTPAPLEMFLDVVAVDFDYAWVREGDVVRLRNPLWFEADGKEAPTWLFKELAARIKKHGCLRLDDELWLVRNCEREGLWRLYSSQYKGLYFPNAMSLRYDWHLFRAFSMLTPQQKERCWGEGVPVAEMSGEAQAHLVQWIREARKLDQDAPLDLSPATLTVSRKVSPISEAGDIEGAMYYSDDAIVVSVSGLPPDPQSGSTELQRWMRLTKRWPAEVLAALP